MSKISDKNDISYVRITVSLPKDTAEHVMEIPAQERSKEIAEILKQEFKRRDFLDNLYRMKKRKALLPKTFKLPRISQRKIHEIFD